MRTLSVAVLALAISGCSDDACDPDARNTICTIAGIPGVDGYAGDDGPALAAQMYTPLDIAMSPQGELWIVDFNNYMLRAIDTDGVIHRRLGSGELGNDPPAPAGTVPALAAALNHATDIQFVGDSLYMAAWHQSRVLRLDLATSTLSGVAGRGGRLRYDGDGGPAIDAAFDLPSAIASAPDGSLVVTDQGNQVIRRIATDGTVTTLAGSCLVVESGCGPGDTPVACPGSAKLTCTGECDRSCDIGFAGDGGPASELRMALPNGATAMPSGHLAYAPDGSLVLADTENYRIRRIGADGIVTTIAGTGERGYGGDGGPAIQALLASPVDIEIAPDGTIYFTDVGNDCVRAIAPTGTIAAVAGVCAFNLNGRYDESHRAGDGGPPTEALLNRPYGIELVGTKLYIADSYNQIVRVANLR